MLCNYPNDPGSVTNAIQVCFLQNVKTLPTNRPTL